MLGTGAETNVYFSVISWGTGLTCGSQSPLTVSESPLPGHWAAGPSPASSAGPRPSLWDASLCRALLSWRLGPCLGQHPVTNGWWNPLLLVFIPPSPVGCLAACVTPLTCGFTH